MTPVPLWQPGNETMFSNLFVVPVGQVALLNAVGLNCDKVRCSDDELQGPQIVCIRRVVFMPEFGTGTNQVLCAENVIALGAYAVMDDVIETERGCWQLRPDNNFGIIGVPGIYRLEINDSTAIGVAQVYAQYYDVKSLPSQIAHLFF